jgi:hypothetical protein
LSVCSLMRLDGWMEGPSSPNCRLPGRRQCIYAIALATRSYLLLLVQIPPTTSRNTLLSTHQLSVELPTTKQSITLGRMVHLGMFGRTYLVRWRHRRRDEESQESQGQNGFGQRNLRSRCGKRPAASAPSRQRCSWPVSSGAAGRISIAVYWRTITQSKLVKNPNRPLVNESGYAPPPFPSPGFQLPVVLPRITTAAAAAAAAVGDDSPFLNPLGCPPQ